MAMDTPHRRRPHPQAAQTGAAERDARTRFGSSWTAVRYVAAGDHATGCGHPEQAVGRAGMAGFW